jgi:hypothetical protein
MSMVVRALHRSGASGGAGVAAAGGVGSAGSAWASSAVTVGPRTTIHGKLAPCSRSISNSQIRDIQLLPVKHLQDEVVSSATV